MTNTLTQQHMANQLGPASAYDTNDDGSGVIISKHLGPQPGEQPAPEPTNSPVPAPVEPQPTPIEKTDTPKEPEQKAEPAEKKASPPSDGKTEKQDAPTPAVKPELLEALLQGQQVIQQRVDDLAQSKQADRIAEAEKAVTEASALVNDLFETGTPEEFKAAQETYRAAVELAAKIKTEASQPPPATSWYENEQTAAAELTKWVETSDYVKDQPYRQERAIQIARFVKPEKFPTPQAYFAEVEAQTRKALGEADTNPPPSKNTPTGINPVDRGNIPPEPKSKEVKSLGDLPKDMRTAVTQFMDFLPQGVSAKEYEQYVLNVVQNNEAIKGQL